MLTLAEIDYDDWVAQVEYATLLTKFATATVRSLGEFQLDHLNRIALAGLVKVGPKGYIHGWIFVGPQPKGSRVFHPHHGHGTVTRSGKRTVGVQFDSGHHAAFEHGARGVHPNVAPAGEGHFGERVRKPRAPGRPRPRPPAATPKKPSATELRAAQDARVQAATAERMRAEQAITAQHQEIAARKLDSLNARLDQANRAIGEGRHAEAINHLGAAAALAPDKATRDRISRMRADLAGRVMGKPAVGPKVPKPAKAASGRVIPTVRHPATPAGVAAAYAAVRGGTGNEYVGLADLRGRLGGTREQQDQALRGLLREPGVSLIPEDNQKALTRAQRDAALRYGNQDNHILHITT